MFVHHFYHFSDLSGLGSYNKDYHHDLSISYTEHHQFLIFSHDGMVLDVICPKWLNISLMVVSLQNIYLSCSGLSHLVLTHHDCRNDKKESNYHICHHWLTSKHQHNLLIIAPCLHMTSIHSWNFQIHFFNGDDSKSFLYEFSLFNSAACTSL